MQQRQPTHIDLFSGIGGFALAAQWAGFRTIAFCEIDKYCQKVLVKNFLADADLRRCSWQCEQSQSEPNADVATMREPASIHSNIFDFDGTAYRGAALLTGGFPCQPFSVAGKRRGAEDERHLWPEMLRVIDQARPAWVLGENVPGIISMELDNVLSDLEGIGYATRPVVIPACAVDAKHRRDRLWIVCRNVSDSECKGLEGLNGKVELTGNSRRSPNDSRTSRSFPTDSGSVRSLGGKFDIRICETDDIKSNDQKRNKSSGFNRQRSNRNGRNRSSQFCSWLPEPKVGRVAHGIPSRMDRLKGLGNAIVPQVAFEILIEIYNEIANKKMNCIDA